MHGAFLKLAEARALSVDFDTGALQFLARQIGADAAFLAAKGAESTPAVLGIDAEAIARAVRGGGRYELELLPVKRAALAARGAAVDTNVLGEATVRRQSYFREVVSRVHGRHSLMAYLSWRGQVRAVVMLGRTRSAFSAEEISRIEDVLPELAAARATYGWEISEPPLARPSGDGWLGRWASRARLLARVATPYGELCVRDRDGFREMVAKAGARELVWTRAALSEPSRSGWPYIELFHVAAAVAERRRSVLFIGLGGGVVVRQFARSYPGIAIDVVEHDPLVLELARKWYDVSTIPGVTFHVADGADFVRRSARTWDIVIVDAFGDGTSTAFGQSEFFVAAARALDPGGALAMNLIGSLDGDELADVLSAASRELDAPRVLPVLAAGQACDAGALRNLVVVWSKRRR